LALTKTIDVVRGVSFVKSGEFKQTSNNDIIQTRVGSKDMILNLIGFMIPSTITPLQCIPIKNVINIKTLDKKEKNGIELVLKYLRETNLNLKNHVSSVVWMFDEETDVLENNTYEQTSKFTMQDRIKHISANLYDKILEELSIAITKIMTDNKITIQVGYKILEYFRKNILEIETSSDIYFKLEKSIFEKMEKIEPYYDKREDAIYNLNNILDEDEKKEKKNKKIKNKKIKSVKINISSMDEYGDIKEKDLVVGMCQHNITLDKILSINKKDFIRYSEELHKFIQQYVIINVNNEPVCKSCSFNLDISKYIEEGEYDNESRTFVSYSTPIHINLEDIIGYEKYNIVIRNMDKLVEKISGSSTILHLTKGTISVKSKRKLIVKNAIDLLNSHNKKRKDIDNREESKETNPYGINKKLSNFWNFELTNNIFQFSSTDIDKYKPIKQNNIIAYLIFLITMEINQSHIMFIGDDKKKFCNFVTFNKNAESLFGGIKIIYNNKGQTKNILDYKILCYIIYIISCAVSSNSKMWFFIPPENAKKAQIVPLIQRAIIHTLIDIINSILKISINDNEIIYAMLSTKFFKKIQTIFSDDDLYNRLKKESTASSSNDKKTSILITQGNIPLTGKFIPMEFSEPERNICNSCTLEVKKKKKNKNEYEYKAISNISNCSDGKYHDWKIDKNQLICTNCKVLASSIVFDEKSSNEIKNKFNNILNNDLATKVCLIDGSLHTFEITNSGETICQKCKKSDNYKYTENELKQIQNLVLKVNDENNEQLIIAEKEISEFSDKKIDYINTAVNKLKAEFNKDDKINMGFLNKLMDEIQKTIGNEFHNFHLTENLYVIDHDHIGNMNNKNIVILESQKKIIEKANHPFFKTNVIYYKNYAHGNIEVFYDATTKVLLGYKEENKNYILNKNYNRRIKLNYSILNKIKLLGYKTPFIKTEALYNKIVDGRENIDTDKSDIKKKIIKFIIDERIMQLKKVIYNLKIVLSRILNGHNEDIAPDEFHKAKIYALVEKYKKKIINPVLTDENGNNLIFKHWKAISSGTNIENIDNTNIKLNYDFSSNDHKIISYEEINKIDNSGTLLTYFLSKELIKFFEYNSNNKILKSQIANFVVDFINTIFDIFNEEKDNSNIDIKTFVYFLTSSTHIEEIEEKSGTQNLEGIYSEYQDPDTDKEKTP
jgi:hypothetical protein